MGHAPQKPQNLMVYKIIALIFALIMIGALVAAEMTTKSNTNPFPKHQEHTKTSLMQHNHAQKDK